MDPNPESLLLDVSAHQNVGWGCIQLQQTWKPFSLRYATLLHADSKNCCSVDIHSREYENRFDLCQNLCSNTVTTRWRNWASVLMIFHYQSSVLLSMQQFHGSFSLCDSLWNQLSTPGCWEHQALIIFKLWNGGWYHSMTPMSSSSLPSNDLWSLSSPKCYPLMIVFVHGDITATLWVVW